MNRAKSKANAKRSKVTTPAALPQALAKRAAALSRGKQARLAREARALVSLVKRRRTEIVDAFYDIGEALTRLKPREMWTALGQKSFAQLCEKTLSLSVTFAEQLIGVVARMTRDQAIAMGQTRAIAMVDLAAATPEDDTPAQLFKAGRVRGARGATLDVKHASVQGIRRFAKDIRSAHASGKPRRGRTTTAEERAHVARIAKALHAAGLKDATAEVLASKPGQVSFLRLGHVPLDRIAILARVLAKLGNLA